MKWINSGKLEELMQIPKDRILIYDTETTGTDAEKDEILQLSILDGNGNVLFSSYIKPEHHTTWKEAAKINGITPEMVANAPTFKDIKREINTIFHHAQLIVGYNVKFDNGFIKKNGIYFREGSKVFDVMTEFSAFRNHIDSSSRANKWYKLVECANFFNYTFDAHDALEDTRATLHCFNSMIARPEYQELVSNKQSKEAKPEYNYKPFVSSEEDIKKKTSKMLLIGIALLLIGIIVINIGGPQGSLSSFGTLMVIVGIVILVVNSKKKNGKYKK